MRQHDLWWHDLLYLVKRVEKAGSRAWIWSDVIWHHGDEFPERMPKSVLQSNWYYGSGFTRTPKVCWCGCGKKISYVQPFLDMDAQGYDQVPTGSSWSNQENFGRLVTYGIASREQNTVQSGRLMRGSQSVVGFWLMHCLGREDMVRGPLEDRFARAARGDLKPLVGETYPLSEARRAHEDFAARRTSGKLLLDPGA